MQLDAFMPSLSLAFEYQGQYHYYADGVLGPRSTNERKKADQEKRIKCEQEGITLIEIPYWWRKDKGSLIATIHNVRPDLISSELVKDSPIPSNPPSKISTPKDSWILHKKLK
jgi:hypothetical protein